jgi:hypothetical protein
MKKVTKKITLTIDEYILLEMERDPFRRREKTPVSDKLRRAGIDPSDPTLMIEHKVGSDFITITQTKYKLDFGERLEHMVRSFYHYIGLIPSPARTFAGHRTLRGDIKRLLNWIRAKLS